MYNLANNIYTNYIENFLNNLYNFFTNDINYNLNICDKVVSYTVKFYFNLLNFKVNNYSDSMYNNYLDSNYDLYYCINVPLKITFNNLKTFYINYNIINIPKISQSGDILLNGYSRIPVLYLQLVTKYVNFKFKNIFVIQYFLKLKRNLNLYIYIYNNNIYTYLNKYKLHNNLFYTYNNIKLKNKYINLNCLYDNLYLLNLKNNKKYSILNKNIFNYNFIFNTTSIEISNIINKFINIKFNKKPEQINDNLIHKSINHIFTSFFTIFNKNLIINNINNYFYNLNKYKKNKEYLNIKLFKENLLVSPILHYTNQLNALSYLINKFKINIFGYSNCSNDKFIINSNLRKVQSDYIGLINLINTPDGDTCGLVSTLSNNTLVDKYKLKLLNSTSNILENFISMDISSKNINDIITNNFCNYKKNKIFKIHKIEILKNNEFKIVKNIKNENSKNIDIFNILSITELIIPFLFNDDPCRGLMGSKMHLQALPLVYSESPYVVTKYNNISNLLSFRCIYSSYNGVVRKVDSYSIIISDDKDRFIYYYLYPLNILDYNYHTFYKPVVWEGEKIEIGKILAVSNDLKNEEFTLGFNNFVNYSFYNGYEHEDAIVINKNLLIKDSATSISFDIYEDNLSLNKLNYIELTLSKFLEYEDNYDTTIEYNTEDEIDEDEVEEECNYMLPGEKLFYKIKYELPKSKNKKLFKIFKLIFIKNRKIITDKNNLQIKKGSEGRLIKYEIISHNKYKQLDYEYPEINITYLTVRFFIFRIDRIKIGDKLSGRHGNKGVISKLTESIDLPYTYYNNCPYSITSPIGALARINLGQFLEGYCGHIGSIFNFRIKSPINLYNSYMYSNMYIKILDNYFNTSKCFYKTFLTKCYLRDFKTGYKLNNINLLCMPYYFKLMHTSKSKFQYRQMGKYNECTQQPPKGKNVNGSQKFGEMEIWALESHGTSYNIKELTFVKTNTKLFKKLSYNYKCSESFKILMIELKNILINIDLCSNYKFANNYVTKSY